MDAMRLLRKDRDFIGGNLGSIAAAIEKLREAGAVAEHCDNAKKAVDGIYHFLNDEWNRQESAARRDGQAGG